MSRTVRVPSGYMTWAPKPWQRISERICSFGEGQPGPAVTRANDVGFFQFDLPKAYAVIVAAGSFRRPVAPSPLVERLANVHGRVRPDAFLAVRIGIGRWAVLDLDDRACRRGSARQIEGAGLLPSAMAIHPPLMNTWSPRCRGRNRTSAWRPARTLSAASGAQLLRRAGHRAPRRSVAPVRHALEAFTRQCPRHRFASRSSSCSRYCSRRKFRSSSTKEFFEASSKSMRNFFKFEVRNRLNRVSDERFTLGDRGGECRSSTESW